MIVNRLRAHRPPVLYRHADERFNGTSIRQSTENAGTDNDGPRNLSICQKCGTVQ